MSKPLVPLLTIFLALWLFGGAYWLSNIHPQNASSHKQKLSDHLLIEDGNFKIESPTIFAFQLSEADLIINEEQLEALDKLAIYLDEKKEKKLRLVAYYGKEEVNRTGYDNLGIARAESIKNIIARRGAPERSILVESKQFSKLMLNENGLLSGGIEFEIFDKETSTQITETVLSNEKVFFYENNKYAFSKDLEFEKYVATMKQFLVDNKNAEVIITGYYAKEENEKIAAKRVKFIQSAFIEAEIKKDRIRVEKTPRLDGNDSNVSSKLLRKVEIKVQ